MCAVKFARSVTETPSRHSMLSPEAGDGEGGAGAKPANEATPVDQLPSDLSIADAIKRLSQQVPKSWTLAERCTGDEKL